MVLEVICSRSSLDSAVCNATASHVILKSNTWPAAEELWKSVTPSVHVCSVVSSAVLYVEHYRNRLCRNLWSLACAVLASLAVAVATAFASVAAFFAAAFVTAADRLTVERILDDHAILLTIDEIEVVWNVSAECHSHVTGLDSAAVVVEDEVLSKSVNISYSILEVCILDTCDLRCADRLHAWPSATEVIDITPLIESYSLPASLVVNVNADSALV